MRQIRCPQGMTGRRLLQAPLFAIVWLCVILAGNAPLLNAQTHEETSLWESVKNSKDVEDYKAYLDKYPDGVYAPIAKRRVTQMEARPGGQADQKLQPASQELTVNASSKSQAAVPVTMTECEGTNDCATWTFLGTQGNGQWPSGGVANLSVERYDANSVVIRRADSTGPTAGLTAVYKGTQRDDRVGGEFTSSWPGHWETKAGNWYATVQKNDLDPPSVMHYCAANCYTLQWQKGRYVVTNNNGFEGPDFTSIWTIMSFTRQSISLHRVDTGNFHMDVVYAGRISPDNNGLVDLTWNGKPASSNVKLAWGTALKTVPGSNAERDGGTQAQIPQRVVVVASPIVCVPWFFTVVCAH